MEATPHGWDFHTNVVFFVAFSVRLLTNFAPIYAVYVALIAAAVVAKLRVKRRTLTAATD